MNEHVNATIEPLAPVQPWRQRLDHWWARQVAFVQHLFARAVAWTATRAWQVTADWRAVRPIISRASAHLAILALAVAALVFSGLNLPQRKPLGVVPPVEAAAVQSLLSTSNTSVKMAAIAPLAEPKAPTTDAPLKSSTQFDNNATVVRVVQPHTEIPNRPRRGIITHTVQMGETTESIAVAYGLQATTILWSNPDIEDVPDLLRIGQEVLILPVDGVYHTVAEDDTLSSIAEKYKADAEAITSLSYNDLRAPLYRIQEGMKLIVPGGAKPYVPRRVTSYSGPIPTDARGTGAWVWPVSGMITQGYWWGHRAIDIGAPTGSAVLSSDGGFVAFVGWTDIGYGYLIIIDHGNGYSSYYAHLSQMYVTLGQRVERGQVIGAVGSTGNSSGPHLHLEIRYNNEPQNPLVYLP